MNSVSRFYYDVIDDVIASCKDELFEDGVDSQLLNQLKNVRAPALTRPPVQVSGRTFPPGSYVTTANTAPVRLPTTNPLNNVAQIGGGALRLPIIRTTSAGVDPTLAGVRLANPTATQPQVATVAAARPGLAPGMATLPSGISGHLIQVGQQTYLVPHQSAMMGLRPPTGGPVAPFGQQQAAPGQLQPHLVLAAPPPQAPIQQQPTVQDQFPRTQIDGTNTASSSSSDDDDDLIPATPGSVLGMTPRTPFNRPTPLLGTPQTPLDSSRRNKRLRLSSEYDGNDEVMTATPSDRRENDDDYHHLAKPSTDRSSLNDTPVPDDDDDPVDDDDDNDDQEDDEPLNSQDDVSDEEADVLFESENVVVCQYDKIHRARNKWRFHLRDGIMAINGRDHVFQKALGEAEW